MVKLVHKAFVQACSKELTAWRYGITHPWLAARDGKDGKAGEAREWAWCATDGKIGVMRALPSEDAEALEADLAALPEGWMEVNAKGVEPKLVVERETIETGALAIRFAGTAGQPRIMETRKDGGLVERRMVEATPPDLPSIIRGEERAARQGESAWIDVDADAMVRALEALLAGVKDLKGDKGPTRKMVRMWFRIDAEAVNSGAAKFMIDGSCPILVETTHETLRGSAAVVMPMGKGEAEEKERKEAIRKGKRAIEKAAARGASVDAEERVAMAKEGGMNA